MAGGSFRFDRFLLDPVDRRLRRDGTFVDLSARYLDALVLLVRENGRLISKERFHKEVWSGVPVTDEALTQCIKTLRRQLDDSASTPRFIETVPKHGYRFIAPVESVADGSAIQPASTSLRASSLRRALLLGAAGTIGAGIAGLVGGLFYGLVGASQPLQPGVGSVSILLVLVCLTIMVALTGGAGVAFGVTLSEHFSRRSSPWLILGGALGGMFVGAVVKFLGIDAFNLLLGRSPGNITGPFEGMLLGAAVGLAAWLATRVSARPRLRRGTATAGLLGFASGVLITVLGGRMMGGSLDLLAHSFPGSRLRLDKIGELFGEADFGLLTQAVTNGLEGGLFAACVIGAMIIARRDMDRSA